MDIELEKLRQKYQTPPEETPQAIAALKDALDDPLLISGYDPALLARQAEILDRLFTAILDQKVAGRFDSRSPETVQQWMHFALRIQKQCTDTVKSKAAIDYMSTLNALNTAPYPRKIDKQND